MGLVCAIRALFPGSWQAAPWPAVELSLGSPCFKREERPLENVMGFFLGGKSNSRAALSSRLLMDASGRGMLSDPNGKLAPIPVSCCNPVRPLMK